MIQPQMAQFDELKIDAIFAALNQCHLPGAVVGIARGGRPVYRKGFGLANMEMPAVLTPGIRMRIYSITKHFTCLAYMLLCEENKAGIDDQLGQHLPELHPVAHPVTMRQLMGNISGLRDAADILWQFSGTGRNVSARELLSLYCDIDDVNCPPGTDWIYNNGGYVLLTAVVERISGRPLEEVLRTRIFEPVGMHDTLLRRCDSDFLSNSATMHMVKPGGGFERSYLGTVSGEGGIVSTVDDMLRWLAHMDAPRIGSVRTWEIMRTPQILANGVSTGYGLGLISGYHRGIAMIQHSGMGLGANSQMIKVPDAQLDVAIMVNRHDISATDLANRILDVCLPNILGNPKSGSSFSTATGTFRSADTGRVFRLEAAVIDNDWIKAGQQIAVVDGIDVPLQSDDDGTLRPSAPFDMMMKLTIVLQGNRQNPESLRITDYGNADELFRQDPPASSDPTLIAGSYRSHPTGTEATITAEPEATHLRTSSRFGSALYLVECLAIGIWRARSPGPVAWGGILSFNSENSAFYFSSARTRRLRFCR